MCDSLLISIWFSVSYSFFPLNLHLILILHVTRPMGDTSRPEGRKVCSPTPSSLTLTPFAPPARDDIMR